MIVFRGFRLWGLWISVVCSSSMLASQVLRRPSSYEQPIGHHSRCKVKSVSIGLALSTPTPREHLRSISGPNAMLCKVCWANPEASMSSALRLRFVATLSIAMLRTCLLFAGSSIFRWRAAGSSGDGFAGPPGAIAKQGVCGSRARACTKI